MVQTSVQSVATKNFKIASDLRNFDYVDFNISDQLTRIANTFGSQQDSKESPTKLTSWPTRDRDALARITDAKLTGLTERIDSEYTANVERDTEHPHAAVHSDSSRHTLSATARSFEYPNVLGLTIPPETAYYPRIPAWFEIKSASTQESETPYLAGAVLPDNTNSVQEYKSSEHQTVLKTSVDIRADSISHGVVSAELFGGITVNNTGWDNYKNKASEMGLTFIRFPGGTIAEVGNVVDGKIIQLDSEVLLIDLVGDREKVAYDLTFPELINPAALAADDADGGANDVATLSEIFEYAVEIGGEASVIIPVKRYIEGLNLVSTKEIANSLSVAKTDLVEFLDRLGSHYYNNGKYPETIVLEIGNEEYNDPIGYALLARTLIETIEEELANTDVNFEIAFQMNIGSAQYKELIGSGYFAKYFDDYGNALIPELEGVNIGDWDNLSYSKMVVAIDDLMIQILGESVLDIDRLRHHYLAIDDDNMNDEDATIQQRSGIYNYWLEAIDEMGGDPAKVDYYVSAWTVDSSNYGDDAFGMPAAVNALEALMYFMEMGVDQAALWGVAAVSYYSDDMNQTTFATSIKDDAMSPHAEVVRLMSESLAGAEWLDLGFESGLTPDRYDDYVIYAFESDDAVVLFIGVGELGDSLVEVDLNLIGFGGFESAQIDSVETISGDLSGPAKVETSIMTLNDSDLAVTFDEDFEVARVIFEKTPMNTIQAGPHASVNGTDGPDLVVAVGGDVIMGGHAGNDTLRALEGSNTLYGNDGDDLLFGGRNKDNLFGGDGDDQISDWGGDNKGYGGSGEDIITLHGGNSRVESGDGSDIVRTGWDDDIIYGGNGDDLVDTDYGSELLFGNDKIVGGSGDDVLRGGAGADTFIFNPSGGSDVIADFEITRIGSLDGSTTSYKLIGADFELGVDTVHLEGFKGVNENNILTFLSSSGSDTLLKLEGTTVVFHDTSMRGLSIDDFTFG